ncbi:MAG: NAD(P)/FAD-dependent oxidoreductase [Allorhizobium sp.]
MITWSFSDPVWKRPTGETLLSSDIDSGEEVDVAIVGGGFQGLSTALHAARHGLSVRLVEARTIGEGASGLNGGQVIPGFKYDPEWLIEHFGPARGEALASFGAGTADVVFDLIESNGLNVDHIRAGWIQAATTETALKAATERNRQWRGRGADVALLNSAEIALMTGAEGYLGGWFDRRAGAINPLAFALELARLAVSAGARITEDQTVTSLRRDGALWRLETEGGASLRARSVVVATNAYSQGLVPGLAQSLVALNSFQIATAPLSDKQLATILPHGQVVSDSRRILVYYRRSPDGRLVLGGRGGMKAPDSDEDWAHLERAMRRLYPDLAGIAIERRWFGRVAMTPDHLPHIHQPEKGLLIAAGCQGRGVGLMTALGRCFGDYLASGDASLLPFPVTPIAPITLHRFRRLGVAGMIAWYRMLDGLES